MPREAHFQIDLNERFPDSYQVVEHFDEYGVFVCRPIKAFLTKSVAELHAKAWNEGRIPPTKNWRKPYEYQHIRQQSN